LEKVLGATPKSSDLLSSATLDLGNGLTQH